MEKRVFIAQCRDYEKENVQNAVRRALLAFGGASAFSVKGKKVLIKVNLLSANKPDRAVTSHPEVAASIAREFVEAGAEVIIADSPGGPYNSGSLRRVYSACGMDKAAEESGAILNFDTTHRRVQFHEGKYAKEFDIISPVLDADLVVSAAKLKTHGLAYYTGAVKNLFGAVPGLDKAAFHSRYPNKFKFNGVLVDICRLVKPQLSFIDGVVGMEGAGPSGGNPKNVGIIAASLNPYALDMAMCDLVSLPVSMVPVLTEAISLGLAPSKVSELEYLGDDKSAFKTRFKPAVSGGKGGPVSMIANFALPKSLREKAFYALTSWPEMTEKCIACGKCAEICPRQVITIENKRAKPDYSGCIRCYCCHEICPVQAIELVRRSKTGRNR
jgi:uncharacterized protein (DUF362 family)/Pyruvate/2-oxoacid:ferredoxin oxidoreductase delta subunit